MNQIGDCYDNDIVLRKNDHDIQHRNQEFIIIMIMVNDDIKCNWPWKYE